MLPVVHIGAALSTTAKSYQTSINAERRASISMHDVMELLSIQLTCTGNNLSLNSWSHGVFNKISQINAISEMRLLRQVAVFSKLFRNKNHGLPFLSPITQIRSPAIITCNIRTTFRRILLKRMVKHILAGWILGSSFRQIKRQRTPHRRQNPDDKRTTNFNCGSREQVAKHKRSK